MFRQRRTCRLSKGFSNIFTVWRALKFSFDVKWIIGKIFCRTHLRRSSTLCDWLVTRQKRKWLTAKGVNLRKIYQICIYGYPRVGVMTRHRLMIFTRKMTGLCYTVDAMFWRMCFYDVRSDSVSVRWINSSNRLQIDWSSLFRHAGKYRTENKTIKAQ